MWFCPLSRNYLNQLLNVPRFFFLGSRNLMVTLKAKTPTGFCMSACHKALQSGIFFYLKLLCGLFTAWNNVFYQFLIIHINSFEYPLKCLFICSVQWWDLRLNATDKKEIEVACTEMQLLPLSKCHIHSTCGTLALASAVSFLLCLPNHPLFLSNLIFSSHSPYQWFCS